MPREQTPPQNLDAEEYVVGACLLGGARAVEATRDTLSAPDFYRLNLGLIWATCVALVERGEPVDAITVAAELERHGELGKAGGRARLHELAAIVPATANVGHHAQLVRAAARDRAYYDSARALSAAAINGGVTAHPETLARIRELLDTPDGRTMTGLDFADVLSGPLPETAWLWHGWLVQGDLCLLVGDPKAGKSLVALGLADAVRRGLPFLGAQTTQTNVGIVDLENPKPEVVQRLRRIGLTPTSEGLFYFHYPRADLQSPDGVATLMATIAEHGLGLVVLDSFRRIAPGIDENDSASISAFFAPLRRITATTGCTIIVVHHARKRVGEGQDRSAGQMTRGSGDFLAVIDCQLYLRKTEPGSVTIEHGANRHGHEHQPLRIAVSAASDERLEFHSEGVVLLAETLGDEMLVRAVAELRAAAGPLTSTILKMKLGVDSAKESKRLYRALDQGYDRGILAKTTPANPRDPTEWALVPEAAGEGLFDV